MGKKKQGRKQKKLQLFKEKLISRLQIWMENLVCGAKLGLRSPLLHLLKNGTNSLKVTSEPPPTAGQADCLQRQDRSAVTHTSSNHARRCLIRLSCDNQYTRYTAPLALEHSKNRCVIKTLATLWMSRSSTSLIANVEILGLGQFNRSGLLREMAVGIGGDCSLTSEVLASLDKGVLSPANFNWRCWFRVGLPFFRGDITLRLVP
ncbi:hypothetical protein J6590_073331 [Homalodisca vitripennis]|nr:hypothetical protein J6590_073331 [Homalodisca vitripennis]